MEKTDRPDGSTPTLRDAPLRASPDVRLSAVLRRAHELRDDGIVNGMSPALLNEYTNARIRRAIEEALGKPVRWLSDSAARASSLEADADKPDFYCCEKCGALFGGERPVFPDHAKYACPGPVRPAKWLREEKP